MKKRRKVSYKFLYLIIIFLFLILISVSVYAFNSSLGVSVMGHNFEEISPPAGCASGQAVMWNGASWVCGTTVSGIDSKYTTDSSGLCFDAPAYCTSSVEYCTDTRYVTVDVGQTCDSFSSDDLDTICWASCYNQLGYACDGDTSSNCNDGTHVYYSGSGAYCEGGSIVSCFCSVSSVPYTKEQYHPAGKRCI